MKSILRVTQLDDKRRGWKVGGIEELFANTSYTSIVLWGYCHEILLFGNSQTTALVDGRSFQCPWTVYFGLFGIQTFFIWLIGDWCRGINTFYRSSWKGWEWAQCSGWPQRGLRFNFRVSFCWVGRFTDVTASGWEVSLCSGWASNGDWGLTSGPATKRV